jgi:hypothetical protein
MEGEAIQTRSLVLTICDREIWVQYISDIPVTLRAIPFSGNTDLRGGGSSPIQKLTRLVHIGNSSNDTLIDVEGSATSFCLKDFSIDSKPSFTRHLLA